MKHLRNPISGEVIATTPLEAKSKLRYGWKAITRAEYDDAKRQTLAYIVNKQLGRVKVRMH